jgi:hypothetical protein
MLHSAIDMLCQIADAEFDAAFADKRSRRSSASTINLVAPDRRAPPFVVSGDNRSRFSRVA